MKSTGVRVRRVGRWTVLIVAALDVAWAFLPPPRAFVETWYSRGLYRSIASALVRVTDAVPFSLSVAGLALLVALLIAYPVSSWRRWRKDGASPSRVLLRWLGRAAASFTIGYAVFIALWGAGYRRERLEDRLGLRAEKPAVDDPTESEVARWVSSLTRLIASDMPPHGLRDGEKALASLRASLAAVVGEWDGSSPALPRRVKLVPEGAFLVFGSTGLTVPFLLEPHVDAAAPEAAFLAVAAHELAHVAGFCAEADADFAAAVAGMRADDAYARYAVALWLFEKFARDLPRPKDVTAAYAALPADARADLDEMRIASTAYRVASLAAMQSKVYDTFLRSQGLEHGVKEYSFVVRLLVAAERKGIVSMGGAQDVQKVPGGAAR